MKESTLTNKLKGPLCMICSALFASVGQLLWKLSADKGFLFIILGGLLYCCGAVLMIVSYKFGEASKLHPLQSTSYIMAMIWGQLFLDEPISVAKVAAIILIVSGAVIISGGNENAD